MYDEGWGLLFQQTYESTYANLEYQMKNLKKDISEIEAELEYLYIYQGNGWSGRSEVKEAEIEATVQAYQIFIKKFKEKSGKSFPKE